MGQRDLYARIETGTSKEKRARRTRESDDDAAAAAAAVYKKKQRESRGEKFDAPWSIDYFEIQGWCHQTAWLYFSNGIYDAVSMQLAPFAWESKQVYTRAEEKCDSLRNIINDNACVYNYLDRIN